MALCAWDDMVFFVVWSPVCFFFPIDHLRSISIFCQEANQCWLSKENISFCFPCKQSFQATSVRPLILSLISFFAVYLPLMWIVCKIHKIARLAEFIRSISVAQQLLLFVSCTGCLSSRESSLRSRFMCTTVCMVPHQVIYKIS